MDNLTLDMLKKQSEMGEDIKGIKVSLDYHIKRTDLLEEQVQIDREQLKKDLGPIKKHVLFIDFGLKILGAIGLFTAFVASLIKVVSFFR